MMLVRAFQRLFWFITSPSVTWGTWIGVCGWLWWDNHQRFLAWQPTMSGQDFFAVTLFLLVLTRLVARLHRYTSLPAPVLPRRKGKTTRMVHFSVVRVAVAKRRATGPGEAGMRRRLSPQLQALLKG